MVHILKDATLLQQLGISVIAGIFMLLGMALSNAISVSRIRAQTNAHEPRRARAPMEARETSAVLRGQAPAPKPKT